MASSFRASSTTTKVPCDAAATLLCTSDVLRDDRGEDDDGIVEEVFTSTGDELYEDWGELSEEDNKGRALNKPFLTPGGPKKRAVYVKNDKGNTVKVSFGDPNLSIKRDDPERRKAYRARHGCDNPGPRWKANYWSCKYWSSTPVSKLD